MKFTLNTSKTQGKNKFQPQEQIIEYVRCSKCNTRDTSRLSVGFTLRGLQVWCDTCDVNVVHLRLNDGEYKVDKFPQGNFNQRNMKDGSTHLSNYNVNSVDLFLKRQEEELTDSGIEMNGYRRNGV